MFAEPPFADDSVAELPPDRAVRTWTDDFSSLLSVVSLNRKADE
jgi:hypothetical protein